MSAHTPGPWRWEINRKSKILHLVGGKPQYDLTIMDFDRWGMSRAVATLRDTAHDGMNIMHRLCDRPDWITPFSNRAHHADWCAAVKHPDMQLIEAAPDLLAALKALHCDCIRDGWDVYGAHPADRAAALAAIAKATGKEL